MLQASRRRWRLFYFRLGCGLLALVGQSVAQGPTLTTISDTVYRADGLAAAGTLLISWPAFVTASGATVAAGNNHVTLGTNGIFSAQLAPNAGANSGGHGLHRNLPAERRNGEDGELVDRNDYARND